jgi:hypothetical protein
LEQRNRILIGGRHRLQQAILEYMKYPKNFNWQACRHGRIARISKLNKLNAPVSIISMEAWLILEACHKGSFWKAVQDRIYFKIMVRFTDIKFRTAVAIFGHKRACLWVLGIREEYYIDPEKETHAS